MNASSEADNVRPRSRHCSPPARRGSRCRRTGMAPELPGSRRTVHQMRERNLMRRASTCLAVLGFALLALPGVASAAPTVTFKAKAVPITGFPHTGNILGAGAAFEAEYHDLGHRIRRLPAAADRRQLLPADGREAAPAGLPDVLERRVARTERSVEVPEGLGGRPGRQSRRLRRRSATNACPRTSNCRIVLRARRRARVLHRRPLAGVAGNPVDRPLRATSAAAAASARSIVTRCRSSKRSPARPTRRSRKSIKVKAGSAIKKHGKNDLLRHGPDEVPEGRLPGQGRTHRSPTSAVSNRSDGDGALQGAVPTQVSEGQA